MSEENPYNEYLHSPSVGIAKGQPGYKPEPEIKDVRYGDLVWNPHFDQGSTIYDSPTELRKDTREEGIIKPNAKGTSCLRFGCHPTLPSIEVDSRHQSLWSTSLNEEVKEETRFTVVLRNYKRYTVYFRWAKCGPRWCGLVKKNMDCPHQVILWLDQRPPGWRDENEVGEEDGKMVKGEGWKNGENPFHVHYNGPHQTNFHFYRNDNGVDMRKNIRTGQEQEVVFVD